jgi:hypothetical protein
VTTQSSSASGASADGRGHAGGAEQAEGLTAGEIAVG